MSSPRVPEGSSESVPSVSSVSSRSVRVGITSTFEIAAKHRLPFHRGKCARDHGHNYRLEFTVYGPILEQVGNPASGMVADFGDVDAAIREVLDTLDHYSLNDAERLAQGIQPLGLPDDNPTAEHLAVWLLEALPFVSRVVVWETGRHCAHAERVEDGTATPKTGEVG